MRAGPIVLSTSSATSAFPLSRLTIWRPLRRALCATLPTHSGKSYPLAVEALTFAELAGILSEVVGKNVEYHPRPAADLLAIMERQGAERTYASGLAEGIMQIERGDMPEAEAVFDTVEKVTGRKPVLWRDFAVTRLDDVRI